MTTYPCNWPVMRKRPSILQRYLVAVVLLGVAFMLRYKLYGTLDHRLPFSFFIPATIIAAWYGGLGPGALAALGGLVLGDTFFLPPHSADSPMMAEAERTAIGLYAMNVTLIVLLFWHLHSKLRDAEHQLRKRTGAPHAGDEDQPHPHPAPPEQVRPL